MRPVTRPVRPRARRELFLLSHRWEEAISKREEKEKGNIKGAQTHAEGQHGERTFERLRETNSASRAYEENDATATEQDAGERLTGDRHQRDEARVKTNVDRNGG